MCYKTGLTSFAMEALETHDWKTLHWLWWWWIYVLINTTTGRGPWLERWSVSHHIVHKYCHITTSIPYALFLCVCVIPTLKEKTRIKLLDRNQTDNYEKIHLTYATRLSDCFFNTKSFIRYTCSSEWRVWLRVMFWSGGYEDWVWSPFSSMERDTET